MKSSSKSSVGDYERVADSVRGLLVPGKNLPANVFKDGWEIFLLFDPDRIFEMEFIDEVKLLLEAESARCASLVRLGESADRIDGEDQFLIDRETDGFDYKKTLKGADAGEGWVYDMGRFVCTSNLKGWSIYCERNNEIAIFAIKSLRLYEKIRFLLSRMRASSIRDAIGGHGLYSLPDGIISDTWKKTLLKEYGGGGGQA